MAQTKKEKNVGILAYKIDKEKELAKEWKAHGISQQKIDKLEEKQAKHEAKKVIWDALP